MIAGARRAAILAAALVLAPAGATTALAADFQFQKLNRTYSQFVDQLAPVVLGPVEVVLRSPTQVLELAGHRAALEAVGDGSHRIQVEIDVSGHGTIDAVLRAAGLEGKLSDELTLPRQVLRMDGRVRIARRDDGYAISLVEAPEQVEVRIESKLAGRLVPLCRQMALVLVRFDCAALSDALSRVDVPIPEPGTEFLLPIGELTEDEKRRFDQFLAVAAKP